MSVRACSAHDARVSTADSGRSVTRKRAPSAPSELTNASSLSLTLAEQRETA